LEPRPSWSEGLPLWGSHPIVTHCNLVSSGTFDTVAQMCNNGSVERRVNLTESVEAIIESLRKRDQRKYRKVVKALYHLSQDPGHRGLQSHRYESLDDVFGEKILESYVENATPSAWRLWWFYGPEDDAITVVDLGPHP